MNIDKLKQAAKYLLSTEFDDYTEWCEENGFKPEDIKGKNQSNHPYAVALLGLGLKFEAEETE